MAAVDIPGLENLHCGNELRAAVLGAALVRIGKRCQRTHCIPHDVVALEDFAVITFHRPDRKQDIAVNRETLLDALEPRTPFAGHALANGDRLLVHAIVDVVPDRLGKFRLIARLLQHHRVRRIHAAKCAVERGRRNTCLYGDRTEARDPLAKLRISQCRTGRKS